ncbi:MAG: ribonuclease III domain-containing protein [Myxococcota bacterium]
MTLGLPRTTDQIAAWLGGEPVKQLAGIRTWHGGATVAYALEQVVELPESERGRRFFEIVNEAKRARQSAGMWPRANYRDWYPAGVCAPVLTPEAGEPSHAVGGQADREPGRYEAGDGGSADPTDRLALAETILGYVFRDKSLLKLALSCAFASSANNDALACLGDRIFNAWAARRVYAGAPGASKGKLTDAINSLCKGDTQAAAFLALGLYALLTVGGSVIGRGAVIKVAKASTGLEAIVAAIEIDGGGEAAEAFLDRAFTSPLGSALKALAP